MPYKVHGRIGLVSGLFHLGAESTELPGIPGVKAQTMALTVTRMRMECV